ncbi:MAG: PEBP family protein, partial [Planctomycetota bacterium]
WYWVLYNIPATVTSLSKNAQGIGTAGNNSVNKVLGYAPPHSKGPGEKKYTLTVYALSAPPKISVPHGEVSREVLLSAMKGLVLASTELNVVHTRDLAGEAPPPGGRKGPPRDEKKGPRPQRP